MNKTFARIKRWIHPKEDEEVVNPRPPILIARDIAYSSMFTGQAITHNMVYTSTAHFFTPFYPRDLGAEIRNPVAQAEIDEMERRNKKRKEEEELDLFDPYAALIMNEILSDIPRDVQIDSPEPDIGFGGGGSGGGGSSDEF
jgi:hypothetical protein